MLNRAGEVVEAKGFFKQHPNEACRLSQGRGLDLGVSLPVRLADAEIARDLVPEARALRTVIIGRRLRVTFGRRDPGEHIGGDESALDLDRIEAKIRGATGMTGHQ